MSPRQSRCRLCGLPLALTIENTRRVCTACGEVNLPRNVATSGDEAAPPPLPTARFLGTTITTVALLVLPTPAAALLTQVLAERLQGYNVPLGYPIFGAAAAFVLTLVALFFYAETRTRDERRGLALVVPLSLPVAAALWWYVGLVVLLWDFGHH